MSQETTPVSQRIPEQRRAEAKQAVSEGSLPELRIPDGFECPILKEVMTNPVLALDGHSYEKEAITHWFRTSRQGNLSPMTGQILPSRMLLPNHSLRKAIQDFLTLMPDLDLVLKAQGENRDLMLAIRLCEEDLAAQQEKLREREESKTAAPVDSLSVASSQETLAKRHQENLLGRKVVAFVDAMALHIRSTQSASPATTTQTEAESLYQAITYASTVVRALSKGAGEYNSLSDNAEDYAIPAEFMERFIKQYVTSHGLLALMDHADFARSLSIELGYASQPQRVPGKKDLSAIRAAYARALSEQEQSPMSQEELAAPQASSSSSAGAISSPSTSSSTDGIGVGSSRSASAASIELLLSPTRTSSSIFTASGTPRISSTSSAGSDQASSTASTPAIPARPAPAPTL